MPVGKAERTAYNEEVKDYKKEVDDSTKAIKELKLKRKKMPNIQGYYNIEIVIYLIKVIDIYLTMNDISLDMLDLKNNKSLDNAKSDFSQLLQVMSETVGLDVDRSLRENDNYLIKINRLNPQQILNLVKKINSVFYNLKNKMGEDSKWKWLFVEFQAKVAIIIKNITSFSDVAKYRDPRVEFYYDRQELMQLCKEGLAEAAKQYRNKYELSGRAREDLKSSIDLLSALRKIYVLFGEDEEASKLKNTIDAARQALEAEDKVKDKKGKELKKKKL